MKKLLAGCAIVAALALLAGAAGCWYLLRERPNVVSTLGVPSEVVVDQVFDMVITAENPHDVTVKLDSIDVSDSFLDGFQVVSVTPEPTGTMDLFDFRSFDFSRDVAPGESLVVTFKLRAVSEGLFRGDCDVCNPNQDCQTLMPDVVVRAKPPEAPPAGAPAPPAPPAPPN
jgi:hypothetical protein